MTITCKYSCALCGLKRVEVAVPVREPEEDVVHWMQRTVGRYIATDHSRRSPHCNATELKELLVPLEGRDRIGGPTIQ